MPDTVQDLAAFTRSIRVESIAAMYGVKVEEIDKPPEIPADLELIAHRYYEWRQANGQPGDAHSDWITAQQFVDFSNHRIKLAQKPQSLAVVTSKAKSLARERDRKKADHAFMFLGRRLLASARFYRIPQAVIQQHLDSCGIAVISQLTGKSPSYLSRVFPNRTIAVEEMTDYLRNEGFEVTEMTDDYLNPSNFENLDALSPKHMLLVSFRAAQQQNSWGVIWDDHILHNWEFNHMRSTSMLGRILTMHLLWRPEWEDLVNLRYSILCQIQPVGAPLLDEALTKELMTMDADAFKKLVTMFEEEAKK